MNLRQLFPLGLLLCTLLLALPEAAAKRLALVIGNDQYQSVDNLRNARNDAKLMAQTLRDARFDVTLVEDVDRRAFYAALDALQKRTDKGDEVVFFFAGHGVQVGNNSILLPVDIRASSDKEVEREGVPLLEVQDALKDARVSVLVIDACRDNPFPKVGTRAIGATRGLLPPEPARGQAIILSAGRGQKALDSVPGEVVGNSLFTREFVQVIRQPGVDVRTALLQVRDRVEDKAALTQHEQRPSLVDDLKGSFYLFSGPGTQIASVKPEAVPAPVEQPSTPVFQPGTVFRDCSDCPQMVVIPAGRLLMGSPVNEPERGNDEGPQHEVRVSSFAAAITEVTFAQWDACALARGCSYRPADLGPGRREYPVVNVSWEDAQEYVTWLSIKTGKSYRLLGEAEWEYAARAGTTTPFSTGQTITTEQANFDGRNTYNGSARGGYRQLTVEVRSFAPNAFGLHDMHGNVWEWVEDEWHENYEGAPTEGLPWTKNSGEGMESASRWLLVLQSVVSALGEPQQSHAESS